MHFPTKLATFFRRPHVFMKVAHWTMQIIKAQTAPVVGSGRIANNLYEQVDQSSNKLLCSELFHNPRSGLAVREVPIEYLRAIGRTTPSNVSFDFTKPVFSILVHLDARGLIMRSIPYFNQ